MQCPKFLLGLLVVVSGNCPAQTEPTLPGLVGTIGLQVERQQRAGQLEGCSMVFQAITPDAAYRNSRLVMVVGNLTFYVTGPKTAFFGLKVGVKDAFPADSKIEPPAFAYVQTERGSTAKSSKLAGEGDMSGFRLWIAPANTKEINVVEDILDGKPLTLGFNRVPDGLDVLVRLETDVEETNISDDGKVKRVRSKKTLSEFSACVLELGRRLQR